MMVNFKYILLLFTSLAALELSVAAPGDEIWNFTEVRPGCQSFWWLMYSRSSSAPADVPLVLWLSGGPGASSTGWGNFEEIGPLDWNYLPRNYSWLDHVHLLFIDNPVGTGFSTVESPDLFVTTALENAFDLIATLKNVLEYAPDLVNSPFIILGESAGGRLGPILAQELNKAITAGEINANLQGLIIRDGWVHPPSQIPAFAPYSYETGLIDIDGFTRLDEISQRAVAAYDNQNYLLVGQLYKELMDELQKSSFGVNYYYITATEPPFFSNTTAQQSIKRFYKEYNQDPISEVDLENLMNTVVKPKLETRTPNLREWLYFNFDVNAAMKSQGDHMMSTVPEIEDLLQNTNIKIVVVNGQLDLIVTTGGTEKWVQSLNWSGTDAWKAAPRNPLVVDGIVEGYVKQTDRLGLWWINRAGHSVFYHNPIAGYQLIQEFTAGLKMK